MRTLFLIALPWLPLGAAPILLQGTVSDPDATVSHVFSVAGPSQVSIQSYSYGGGASATGITVPAGGFDPSVYLFDGTGLDAILLAHNDDGVCPPGQLDATTSACLDVTLLVAALLPGDYTLVIALAGNLPAGALGAGFTGGGDFTDVFGSTRDGHYALDLTVQPLLSPVPEPRFTALTLCSLGILSGRRVRRR